MSVLSKQCEQQVSLQMVFILTLEGLALSDGLPKFLKTNGRRELTSSYPSNYNICLPSQPIPYHLDAQSNPFKNLATHPTWLP